VERDGSTGEVTQIRAGWMKNRVWNSGKEKFFSSLKCQFWFWGLRTSHSPKHDGGSAETKRHSPADMVFVVRMNGYFVKSRYKFGVILK
jgi:hypothetical protein